MVQEAINPFIKKTALATTPWASGTVLKICADNCENLYTKNYQSLIGALMYLAVISRPDLIHVVS